MCDYGRPSTPIDKSFKKKHKTESTSHATHLLQEHFGKLVTIKIFFHLTRSVYKNNEYCLSNAHFSHAAHSLLIIKKEALSSSNSGDGNANNEQELNAESTAR